MRIIFKYHWRAIIWVNLIILGSLLPSSDLPSTSILSEIPYLDKIVHFLMYFVFVLFLMAGFTRQLDGKQLKAIMFSALIALACGALIEVLQSMMHLGRTGDSFDMLANTIGTLFGIILFHPLRWTLRNIL